MKEITYGEHENSDHFATTKEEIDAALQTAPNGALFGSSYFRSPFLFGLKVWNTCHDKDSHFAKKMMSLFGDAPVLMSNVNPILRSNVANNILKNHGYFNGNVSYQVVETSNPKKEKLSYHIEPGDVYRVDTLRYLNFPKQANDLIVSDTAEALIKHGTPFSTSILDSERNRVSKLLRDNGYYYYHPSYASYLADTLLKEHWADLRLQMADSVPAEAQHKWYIAKRTIDVKRQFQEELTDSTDRRSLRVRFNGKKSPVRSRVILSNMRDIRSGKTYSYQSHTDAVNSLSTMGLFSSVDFQFTPRDRDSLDLNVLCVLDKPYDFYVQANFVNKLSGRRGPELKVGLTKKNAFRGGEKFDVNLHASYEWQQGNHLTSTERNSYEVGMDASVEWPRLLIPFINGKRDAQGRRSRRLHFVVSPASKLTGSFNIINRPGFYRMHSASGEWSYIWKPKLNITHQLSPLVLTYQKLNYRSEKFDSILDRNSYLKIAMQDMFIPKLQYTFSYASPSGNPNPVLWTTTVTEAGNVTSMVNKAFFGQKWYETNKTMFNNVYAQFLKIETDYRKSWRLNETDHFVFHTNAGVAWSYGNMKQTPYTEQFYIDGANSIRAFSARSLGPGCYRSLDRGTSYVDQTGDIKLVVNFEYRKQLFGSVYGAAFVDAGNVWAMYDDDVREGARFQFKNLLNQTAVGTGIGLRYDMDFLVLRLDWGVGLHSPYKTSKSGFYNFTKFKDSHTLHFAIGYPF